MNVELVKVNNKNFVVSKLFFLRRDIGKFNKTITQLRRYADDSNKHVELHIRNFFFFYKTEVRFTTNANTLEDSGLLKKFKILLNVYFNGSDHYI